MAFNHGGASHHRHRYLAIPCGQDPLRRIRLAIGPHKVLVLILHLNPFGRFPRRIDAIMYPPAKVTPALVM